MSNDRSRESVTTTRESPRETPDTMILDTLQSILQAGNLALGKIGVKPSAVPVIRQVTAGEHSFAQGVEISFETGPIRRLVLACDKRFATEVELLGGSPAQIFADVLPGELAALQPGTDRQVDPWRWRTVPGLTHSRSRRNFRLDYATELGDVGLLIEVASALQIEGRRDPHFLLSRIEEFKLKEQIGEPLADRTYQIKRYLDFLRRTEMDLQIELPESLGGGFRDATYLKQGAESGRSLVCLSLGGLDPVTVRSLANGSLNVFFGILGRLFQFHSEVVPYAPLALDGQSDLPILALAYPAVISAGQRRNAFRIVPSRSMTAEIGPLLPDPTAERPEALASSETRVVNISFTGLKAMASIDALLDVLDEDDEVLVRLGLPGRLGTVEVIGVVRRAAKMRSESRGLQHDIGVEFVRSDPRNVSALEQIRQLVLSEQRRALRERVTAISVLS